MFVADTMTFEPERSTPEFFGNRHAYARTSQLRADLESLTRGYPISPDGSSLPPQRCARMRPPNSVPLPGRLHQRTSNDPTREEATAAERQSSFHATLPSKQAHTAHVQTAAHNILVEQDECAPESKFNRLSLVIEHVRCLWHRSLHQPIPPAADAKPNLSQRRAMTRTRIGDNPEIPNQGHLS